MRVPFLRDLSSYLPLSGKTVLLAELRKRWRAQLTKLFRRKFYGRVRPGTLSPSELRALKISALKRLVCPA